MNKILINAKMIFKIMKKNVCDVKYFQRLCAKYLDQN